MVMSVKVSVTLYKLVMYQYQVPGTNSTQKQKLQALFEATGANVSDLRD